MKYFLRVTLQLFIAGPIIFYFPFALITGIGTIVFLFKGELDGSVPHNLAHALGWIGLIGLYCSILIPLRIIQSRSWLRFSLAACILCGLTASVAIVLDNSDPLGFLAYLFQKELVLLYIMSGPVFVGCWNLFRIFKLGKASKTAAEHSRPPLSS